MNLDFKLDNLYFKSRFCPVPQLYLTIHICEWTLSNCQNRFRLLHNNNDARKFNVDVRKCRRTLKTIRDCVLRMQSTIDNRNIFPTEMDMQKLNDLVNDVYLLIHMLYLKN